MLFAKEWEHNLISSPVSRISARTPSTMTTLWSTCFIPSFACVSGVVYNTERGKKWKFEFGESTGKLGLKMTNKTHTNERIKGSLSSSWMNSPIPSLLLPLWQNESLCETIGMKIWCHLYSHSHENQVIFMIFTGNVLHKHSLCKWKLRRWKSKSAYTLFCFIRMLFFRPRLNILIFLPILGWKHSCIILKL